MAALVGGAPGVAVVSAFAVSVVADAAAACLRYQNAPAPAISNRRIPAAIASIMLLRFAGAGATATGVVDVIGAGVMTGVDVVIGAAVAIGDAIGAGVDEVSGGDANAPDASMVISVAAVESAAFDVVAVPVGVGCAASGVVGVPSGV